MNDLLWVIPSQQRSGLQPGHFGDFLMIMFRLRAQQGWFRVSRTFNYFGISCVHGITFDGRWQTTARVADVIDVSASVIWC